MKGGDAREIARRWVVEEASRVPCFGGAYYADSVNDLPDDTDLPKTSDLERRGERVREYLPRLRGASEAIIAENPQVED